MQQSDRLRLVLLFIACFALFSVDAYSQNKMYFVITGKIIPESGTYEGATVEITKNGTQKNILQVSRTGRFRFELDYFNEYTLTFTQPGSYSKKIIVSTDIEDESCPRTKNYNQFLMAVMLFKKVQGVDDSFENFPVGRILYEKRSDKFKKESYLSDQQIAERIHSERSDKWFSDDEKRELQAYQIF